MAKIVVDGQDIDVPDSYTVLQACEEAGALRFPVFAFTSVCLWLAIVVCVLLRSWVRLSLWLHVRWA
jgi:hypothetical protein